MQQRMQRRMQQDRARPTQIVPATALCYPSLKWVSTSAEGWGVELGAGMWGLKSNPGEGTAVDHEETGVRSSTTRSAPGGSLNLRRSKVPLLRDVQRAGLSSCSGPCLLGHMGGLPLELTRDPPPSLPPPCPYSRWSPDDRRWSSSCYPSTLPPGQPSRPNSQLGSFPPDGLLYSRGMVPTERWGWNHSWAPGAMWL